MERIISPDKSEKPVQTSATTLRRFALSKAQIYASLVIILVIVGWLIFLFKRSVSIPLTTTQSTPQTTGIPESTWTALDTTQWKTYTNVAVGFTLKYPITALFNEETKGATKLAISVDVKKLSSIPEDLPQLMGRADAIKQKDRLEKGEGEGVVKIGPLNGQTETILSQFEVCSVLFTRKLTFYPSDYRVILTVAGPKEAIIAAMPDFFAVDTANCGSQLVWNRDKIPSFETILVNKQGNGIAQEWYDTFNAMVKTISLRY